MDFNVTYKIIPPGVGPDDYESGDLEQRQDVVDLPQPEPGYGPAVPDIQRALADMLEPGAQPIVLRIEQA